MSDRGESLTERRSFLGIMLGGVCALVAGAFSWPVLRFLSPIDKGAAEQVVHIARTQVQPGAPHFFSFQGRPAVLLQLGADKFIALSAVCTHLGCIVKWEDEKGEFLCPCHGGRFSAAGQVLGGPPPKALQTYAVSVAGDEILVG